MKTNPFLITAVFVVAVAVAVFFVRSKSDTTVRISGYTMGTTYCLVIPDSSGSVQELIAGEIEKLFIKLNDSMSLYNPDSELSRFNANQDTAQGFVLSSGLREVIRLSMELSPITRGCFDVTVSPLVELWGFGGKELPKVKPTDEEIAQKLFEVGSNALSFDKQGRLFKKKAGLMIDLGAIAQGYAADCAAVIIERHGIENYLVDVGGEIVCRGKNASGNSWHIGIEKPSFGRSPNKKVNAVMAISNRAIATSGSYRNFYVEDSMRYTHIIDPRTGRPVSHRMLSVTVTAESAARADAFATALMVMGPEEGFNYVESMDGIEAFFIFLGSDGKILEKASSGFPLIQKRPNA